MVYSATAFPFPQRSISSTTSIIWPLSTLSVKRTALSRREARGRGGPAGDLLQLVQSQALFHLVHPQAVQHAVTELEGAGGGDRRRWCGHPPWPSGSPPSHGRPRRCGDRSGTRAPCHTWAMAWLVVPASSQKPPPELVRRSRLDGVGHCRTCPVLASCIHVALHALRRLAPERSNSSRSRLLETRMSIEGDMVVWNGRLPVVHAGAQEVGQHVVAVGGADQLAQQAGPSRLA